MESPGTQVGCLFREHSVLYVQNLKTSSSHSIIQKTPGNNVRGLSQLKAQMRLVMFSMSNEHWITRLLFIFETNTERKDCGN